MGVGVGVGVSVGVAVDVAVGVDVATSVGDGVAVAGRGVGVTAIGAPDLVAVGANALLVGVGESEATGGGDAVPVTVATGDDVAEMAVVNAGTSDVDVAVGGGESPPKADSATATEATASAPPAAAVPITTRRERPVRRGDTICWLEAILVAPAPIAMPGASGRGRAGTGRLWLPAGAAVAPPVSALEERTDAGGDKRCSLRRLPGERISSPVDRADHL